MKITILGTIQDGGLPQLGCNCLNCDEAFKNLNNQRYTSSIVISSENNNFLFDASPDIRYQHQLASSLLSTPLKSSNRLLFDGVFITHLHIGHYTGLMNLGKEGASTTNFPVYITNQMNEFFQSNKPFSYLIERNEIMVKTFNPGEKIFETDDVTISSIEVPHRNEDGNTVAFIAENKANNKMILYLPDIDYISLEIAKDFHNYELILFDGSFFSKNEINRQENVPHPPIKETIELFGPDFHRNFYFTHFNHTNPVLNPLSSEFAFVLSSGYKIATEGMQFQL
ncbi:MAG: Coenzyme PQQ synthesis protein B [Candidatus Heimdallarchaeota archaeon LC_3]|nr:MAG: Coenzyme PQQ synthesis protein B [Candidatus Heimdallarchaeota archaeon LC_3]